MFRVTAVLKHDMQLLKLSVTIQHAAVREYTVHYY
jgi:hypothetical protein